MSFADREQSILRPRKSAVDHLDEFLAALPDAEREVAVRILHQASQKKAMKAFRDEGFPLSYITLLNWKEKHNVI